MLNESIIKLFEGKQVRVLWNEEEEKYYFSVVDVIEVLTDSPRPRKYCLTEKGLRLLAALNRRGEQY